MRQTPYLGSGNQSFTLSTDACGRRKLCSNSKSALRRNPPCNFWCFRATSSRNDRPRLPVGSSPKRKTIGYRLTQALSFRGSQRSSKPPKSKRPNHTQEIYRTGFKTETSLPCGTCAQPFRDLESLELLSRKISLRSRTLEVGAVCSAPLEARCFHCNRLVHDTVLLPARMIAAFGCYQAFAPSVHLHGVSILLLLPRSLPLTTRLIWVWHTNDGGRCPQKSFVQSQLCEEL